MGKEVKTNAVRILERNKVPYELLTYECDEFIDGIHSAEATGTPVAQTYKTLVMQGNHWLCPWRLQSSWHEKSISNRYRCLCQAIF